MPRVGSFDTRRRPSLVRYSIHFRVVAQGQALLHQLRVLLSQLDVGLRRIHVPGGFQLSSLRPQRGSAKAQEAASGHRAQQSESSNGPGHGAIPKLTLHRPSEKKKARVEVHPGGIRERSKLSFSEPTEALLPA